MFRGSTYTIETDFDLDFPNKVQHTVRLALVGTSQVGKSSIIDAMEKTDFNEDIPQTNGFQLLHKKIRINRHLINLYVWDASGNRMKEFIQLGHLKNMDGIMYAFDLTQAYSFSQIQEYYRLICQRHPLGSISDRSFELPQFQSKFSNILVGNKSDLLSTQKSNSSSFTSPSRQQEINLHFRAQEWAKKHGMLYLRVSAKQNSFITDAFLQIIKDVLTNLKFVRGSFLFNEDQGQKIQIEENKESCSCDCRLI